MDTTSLSRRSVLFAGFAVPLPAGCGVVPRSGSHPRRQVRAAAPFDMPAIAIPDFSASARFPITDSAGIGNVFVDSCHVDAADSAAKSTIDNLLSVKTDECHSGYVRNIHRSNVSVTRIAGGVLSVETDVPYRRKTLMPTVGRRLTPVQGPHVSGSVRGTPFVTQNVQGFDNKADLRQPA